MKGVSTEGMTSPSAECAVCAALIPQFGRFRVIRKVQRGEKTSRRWKHAQLCKQVYDGRHISVLEQCSDTQRYNRPRLSHFQCRKSQELTIIALKPSFSLGFYFWVIEISSTTFTRRKHPPVKDERNMKNGLGPHSETFRYIRETISGHMKELT
jgi:hypothetical protein